MGVPWTDVRTSVIKGGGFARIIPCTADPTTKIISVFGVKLDLLKVTDEDDDYAIGDAAKTESLTKTMTTGVVLSLTKTTTTLEATSGSIKTSTGDNADSINIKAIVGYTQKNLLIEMIGKPIVIIVSLGYELTGGTVTHMGFAHLLGNFASSFKESRKEDFSELSISVKGGVVYSTAVAVATYNAIAATSIEAIGMSAVTPVALISNLDALMEGKIVRTGVV